VRPKTVAYYTALRRL